MNFFRGEGESDGGIGGDEGEVTVEGVMVSEGGVGSLRVRNICTLTQHHLRRAFANTWLRNADHRVMYIRLFPNSKLACVNTDTTN